MKDSNTGLIERAPEELRAHLEAISVEPDTAPEPTYLLASTEPLPPQEAEKAEPSRTHLLARRGHQAPELDIGRWPKKEKVEPRYAGPLRRPRPKTKLLAEHRRLPKLVSQPKPKSKPKRRSATRLLARGAQEVSS